MGRGDVVVRPLEEPGAGAALVGLGVKLQGAAFMGLQVLEDKLREAAVLGLELKLLSLKVLVCRGCLRGVEPLSLKARVLVFLKRLRPGTVRSLCFLSRLVLRRRPAWRSSRRIGRRRPRVV